MQLEIYILLQLLSVFLLASTFIKSSPLNASMSALISAVLAIGAWTITTGIKYVWDESLGAYVAEFVVINTPYLAGLNIGIFGLSLMLFFVDMFTDFQDEVNEVPKGLVDNK